MSVEEVLEIYNLLEKQGIKVWLDGGWAVDALLGEQTRPHNDLDVAVRRTDLQAFKDILAPLGYHESLRDENKMWDLLLVNDQGTEIEAHGFDLDPVGKIVEEEYWNGYSAGSLDGAGTISGQGMKCVSVSQLVKTHDKNKRQLKDTDRKDMGALSKKFGVEFP